MKKSITFIVFFISVLTADAQSVGIGTNSPDTSSMLEIASNKKGLLIPRLTTAQRTAIPGPAAGLMVYDTDRKSFYHHDGSIWRILLNNDYWNRVNTFSNYVINLQDSIGIAVVSPTQRLDVSGNIRSRRNLLIDSSINVKGALTADGNIASAGTISASTFIASDNLVVAGTGLVSGSFTNNSSVTINNTDAILQLKNSSGDKGFIQLNGNDLRVGTFATNTSGKFVVRTGSADRLFVSNNGNVGIDVESPIARLQIMNGADASISSSGYLMLGSVTSTNLIFDNNEIMARNNGTTSTLVLQNDGGSVRIGATSVPTGYKFAIDGKMICEELKVKLASTGWPDYVFDGSYHLPALENVEQYVKDNKHLPNIPSAAEVEKNGIEVGDMQKRMIEKIEELTLYIIDLKKQLDSLKKESN